MGLFSRNKIRVSDAGDVKISGRFSRHAAKLESFFRDIGVRGISITLTGDRFKISGATDAQTEQRIRNFLVNECPLPGESASR